MKLRIIVLHIEILHEHIHFHGYDISDDNREKAYHYSIQEYASSAGNHILEIKDKREWHDHGCYSISRFSIKLRVERGFHIDPVFHDGSGIIGGDEKIRYSEILEESLIMEIDIIDTSRGDKYGTDL